MPAETETDWCTLEACAYIARWHRGVRMAGAAADAPKYPKAYASATVTIDEVRGARIAGITSKLPFTTDSYRAADDALREIGITHFTYSRIMPDGRKRIMPHRVPRPKE